MVSTEDILTIANTVFSTMLESEVGEASDHEISDHGDTITGCVQIGGQWRGAVMVEVSHSLANQAASSMLAIDEDEVEAVDREDTIAELTNMIGGNIKSLVPGPSNLSLPSVTAGSAFDTRILGTTMQNNIPLACNGHSLRVVVLGTESQPSDGSLADGA